MYTTLIWSIAIGLEAAILFRGLKERLPKRFLFFYCYIASLLLIELLRFFCYRLTPNLYGAFYWHTELIRIVTSYAVVFEIFKRALRHNPGVAHVTQKWLRVIFVIAFSYAVSDLLHGGFASYARATADLGRYLLYIEALLLVFMLWLFGHYRISFGANLQGLTLGYSWLVALDIVNLAFLSTPGNQSSVGLRRLIPITHLVTFIIWCVALWSSQPEPLPPAETAIDRDYGRLVAKTKAGFAQLSMRVGRTLRP